MLCLTSHLDSNELSRSVVAGEYSPGCIYFINMDGRILAYIRVVANCQVEVVEPTGIVSPVHDHLLDEGLNC